MLAQRKTPKKKWWINGIEGLVHEVGDRVLRLGRDLLRVVGSVRRKRRFI